MVIQLLSDPGLGEVVYPSLLQDIVQGLLCAQGPGKKISCLLEALRDT
jgi:hypothetical protein